MSQHERRNTTADEPTEAATDESTPVAADEPTTDEPTADDAKSFDPDAEGKAEAKRLLKAVEADTERARAEAALARKREGVERLNRQLADAKQRRQQTRERIEAMEYTVERLEAADADQLVVQRLEGGVSLGVPADEREEVREDLRERTQHLEQQLETVDAASRPSNAACGKTASHSTTCRITRTW
ncbi:hypothetical protein [Halorussus sp. MSC15.2]|uniref:hypothetical protein n=1 Tax=Halorussus sp. MSC15.2 TaxID=2283638 RepID=UPI0013CFBD6F|nr:hypothetical protein [Halorussus sp. MSC15.2]NEU58596.1 hypothetical protein [Halorussus sp. MSC15.2]